VTGQQSENPTTLTVDFAGDTRLVNPGQELTFGRGSKNDLEIDANPQLHRKFGQIFFRDGHWWLRNRGRRIPLNVLDTASRSSITLTSGREISLTFDQATIAFSAGASNYELAVTITGGSDNEDTIRGGDEHEMMGMTIDQSQVPLVGEQRLLAVALSESLLREPHKPLVLPTNKAVAHRFGWSMTTFNRKLDRMCKKYARAGVSGLVGGPGGLASDRRTRLVEHLVSTGAITVSDLDLLDQPPPG
jgi:hypothetical protein